MTRDDELTFLDKVSSHVRQRSPKWVGAPRDPKAVTMVIDNPKRHHPCEQPKAPFELIMLDVFGIVLHCSQINEVNYLERYPSQLTDNAEHLWKMVWRHRPRYSSSRAFSGDHELYESDMTKLRLFIP